MNVLAISIGAVLGANARYLLGGWIADRMGATFPYGTLAINLTGSFLLGVVLTLVVQRGMLPMWVQPAIAVGFLGSFTTFSTFSYETLSLITMGSVLAAAVNIVLSVGGAIAGVLLGIALTRLVVAG